MHTLTRGEKTDGMRRIEIQIKTVNTAASQKEDVKGEQEPVMCRDAASSLQCEPTFVSAGDEQVLRLENVHLLHHHGSVKHLHWGKRRCL